MTIYSTTALSLFSTLVSAHALRARARLPTSSSSLLFGVSISTNTRNVATTTTFARALTTNITAATGGTATSTTGTTTKEDSDHRPTVVTSSNDHTISRVLVVGSGCNGLRTALELLRQSQKEVVLLSPRHFHHASTASQGAGGFWFPFHCDDTRVDDWAVQTLDELWPMTNTPNDHDHHDNHKQQQQQLVELVPSLALETKNHVHPVNTLPRWSTDPRLEFQAMTVEMLHWQNKVRRLRIPSQDTLHEAGYDYCWLFRSPVVDCPKMLRASDHMYEEIKQHPLTRHVDVETGRDFASVDDMVQAAIRHGCDTIVNCTGLGSQQLLPDEQLRPGRGVLLHYDRLTCARRRDFLYQEDGLELLHDAVIITDKGSWTNNNNNNDDETAPVYLIPRGDVLCVGGTFLLDDTTTIVRDQERNRLIQNAHLLGIDTQRAPRPPVDQWVGFRPVRPTVRLEIDPHHPSAQKHDLTLVHNYGHGGSGWTVYVGAAKEVCALLDEK